MPNEILCPGFRERTTFKNVHAHGYSGVTGLNPDVPGHLHHMTGATTFDEGHMYRCALYTSPGIPADGGRTHYYRKDTSFYDGYFQYQYVHNAVFSG